LDVFVAATVKLQKFVSSEPKFLPLEQNNRSIIGEDVNKSKVARFLAHPVECEEVM